MISLEIYVPQGTKMHKLAKEGFYRKNNRHCIRPSKEARSKKHAVALLRHMHWLIGRHLKHHGIQWENWIAWLVRTQQGSYLVIKEDK